MSAHTVQQLRFEVDVATPAEAAALQASVSAFGATELEPILDACLSGLVGDDQFLRLDTLELELGRLSVERMASELAPRIESALSSALGSALHVPADAPRMTAARPVALHLERLRQLEIFLERGILPWSAGSRTLGLDGLLDALIETAPDALRRSLTGRDHRAIRCRRLATQFARATLERLVSMLMRERADAVLACIDALLRIHRQKPLLTVASSQFEAELWAAALDSLLSERLTAFDEERFLWHLIRALAHRYGVAAESLAEGLLARVAFVALEFSVRSLLLRSLSARVARPAAQTLNVSPRANATKASLPREPLDALDTLMHLLAHGNLPTRNLGLAPESSQQWLSGLLRRHPVDLIAGLKSMGDRPDAVRRLVQGFDWKALSTLIQALEPDYAGFILTYLLTGERIAVRRPAVRLVQWCATLGWLLDPHGQRFETTAFVHRTSQYSARRLNLSHGDFLQELRRCARAAARSEARFAPLEEILSATLDRVGSSAPRGTGNLPVARAHAPADAATVLDPAPIAQPSPAQLQDTIFLTHYFLQYGSLPRQADVSRASGLRRRIAAALASGSRPMEQVLLAAASRPLPRMRMAVLFPPRLLDAALRALAPDAAAHGSRLLAMLRGRRRKCAAELLLACVAERPGRRWDAVAILAKVLKALARAESTAYAAVLLELRASIGRDMTGDALEIRPLLDRLAAEAPADSPADTHAPSPAYAPATQDETRLFPEASPSYVDNAGMVLLWPFLGRYFELLDLLREGRFRNPECAHRAVHLLQFLAGGNPGAAEYELLLNKILCGIDPCDPVETGILMSESEAQLSVELLHGVCQNWPPLQNTSIQGLRESFLCREGRLLYDGDSWSLAVSAKSYDLLLDSLPWKLSMIRLPWMKNLLRVQWR